MNRVTVDQPTRAKLADLGALAELCDDSGRVFGYFYPATDDALYEGYESPNSAEELERRAREGGGRSLVDIMADLEKRS